MSTRDTVLGSGAVFILFDAVINGFELILATIDIVFPMVAVTAGTLAPNFEWLDETVWQHLLVFVAMLYLLHLSLQLIERLTNETD